MRTLVFFLEEPSAEAMLKGLLPRLMPPDWNLIYVVFEGKQDLEKQIPRKLKAWRQPDCIFVILRDKDKEDCLNIKKRLIEKCVFAKKTGVLVRIAIHELESWYLGDLLAVEKGLGARNISRKQISRKFREPDRLVNPVHELKKLTENKYQKVSGSRAIGPYLSINNNYSHSFNTFISGIKRIVNANNI